MGQASKV